MKLRIVLKSFNEEAIMTAYNILHDAAKISQSEVSSSVFLPKRIKKYCVIRSPHIDKDGREQFELRLHKCFLDITTNSSAFVELLLDKELPFGVACNFKVL